MDCPKKQECSCVCDMFRIGGCFQRSELDDCPGCGSGDDLTAIDMGYDDDYFAIICKCGWSAGSEKNIRAAIDVWNKRTPTPAPALACKWTYDEGHDKWDTGCGEAHCFMADGPKENSYGYCPYCGRELKAALSQKARE